MHLKYHGHQEKQNKDGLTSNPINSLILLTIFFFTTFFYRWFKGWSPTDFIGVRIHTLIQKSFPLGNTLTEDR